MEFLVLKEIEVKTMGLEEVIGVLAKKSVHMPLFSHPPLDIQVDGMWPKFYSMQFRFVFVSCFKVNYLCRIWPVL